jgi:hypothetical protein
MLFSRVFNSLRVPRIASGVACVDTVCAFNYTRLRFSPGHALKKEFTLNLWLESVRPVK